MTDEQRSAPASARRGPGERTEPIAERPTDVAPAAARVTPPRGDPDAKPILEVRDLRMYFPVKSSGIIRRTVGHVQAVDGVSFQVPDGRRRSAWWASRAAASRRPAG